MDLSKEVKLLRKYMFLRPRKGTQSHKKRFQVAGSAKTQGEALRFPQITISKDIGYRDFNQMMGSQKI